MSIVLNEYTWAESVLRGVSLGKKPYETMTRVAKYYIHNGMDKKDTRRKLDEFLLKCEPTASLVSWSDTLDNAVKSAQKYDIVMIPSITITKPEMEKIDALCGVQLQRLAFTLLCIAKYFMVVSGRTNYWVSTPDNEIMNMANINTSIKRQSAMFGQLRDAGYIRFSKQVDNLSVQVLFAEDGEDAVEVRDFRNLGYQYMKYHGGPYFECENCGIVTKRNNNTRGRKQKYCSSCASEIKMQQSVNSVMRRRPGVSDDDLYSLYMHIFPNKKKYIGITRRSLRDRWRGGCGYMSQENLNDAIKKYGWDNISHYIFPEKLNIQKARAYEAGLITRYKTDTPAHGYNLVSGKYANDVNRLMPEVPDFEWVLVDSDGTPLS